MTTPRTAPKRTKSVTLPAGEVARLAELLDDLDELLRSPRVHDVVWSVLRAHAAEPGRPDAGYLIDMVSFSAMRLRAVMATIGSDADADRQSAE